jgi:hypothetical protein
VGSPVGVTLTQLVSHRAPTLPGMVTFDDVSRIALGLPETEETTSYGNVSWAVKSGGSAARGTGAKSNGFVWERPLSKKDRKLLTEAGEIEVPPDEVILAARVEDLAEKEAVLAEHVGSVFTTPHFDGYPAVLVRLDRVDEPLLREIVVSAWLAVAPSGLAEQLPTSGAD